MGMAIKEFDVIALLCDLPVVRLRAGQTGTVVFVHNDGEVFEVEFPMEPPRSVVETVRVGGLLKLLNLGTRRVHAASTWPSQAARSKQVCL